jgi:hypothetical protein
MKIYNWPGLIIALLKIWNKIKELKTMKDPKTTITAIVTLLAVIVGKFGFEVSTEIQLAIVTIGMFFVGLFAKDSLKATPSDNGK